MLPMLRSSTALVMSSALHAAALLLTAAGCCCLPCLPAGRCFAACSYVELGCVVVGAIEEPPLSVVRVLRADLVRQARLYDAPVWSGTSSDNMYWQCSIWQVDNPCSTFVAVRGSNGAPGQPSTRQALAPTY